MTGAIFVTGFALLGVVAVAMSIWVMIASAPEAEESEPMEIEPPRDDRWGHHAAIEDRD